eukprot:648123-Rhodomonas_salina.3
MVLRPVRYCWRVRCYEEFGTDVLMVLPGRARTSVPVTLATTATWYAICLRAPYAVSGTDVAYGATQEKGCKTCPAG